ncbi:MAG TPA: hypothetical protein VI583_09335 [Cyclobacteriaceae bacterium]|nr:hypothetical protein [Cyclobacteriaceae bacterium]
MKNTFLAILIAAGLLSITGCKSGSKTDQATDVPETETQQPADEMTQPADSTMAQDTAAAQM